MTPSPTALPHPLHPAQRRYLAEDLIRLRRSNEQRRYAAPQRAANVGPSPHQIEAGLVIAHRTSDSSQLRPAQEANRRR